MQEQTFASFNKKYKEQLENEMMQAIARLNAPANLKRAMSYSLEAGGKRIRPMLLFATIAAFQKDPLSGIIPAAALEMIHTYSLIHDDLPSMDNDDLRRGLPTNHKVFGEATAILAGDALLTYSFQLIAMIDENIIGAEKKLRLIELLSKSAGAEGMIAGQTADMDGEGKQLTLDQLEYIHIHKTGKLLEFSVLAGAIISDATEIQIKQLAKFAYHIGIAFQIRDDILDIEGDEQSLGKRVGSDLNKDKNTYPSLLMMAGAKKSLAEHIQQANKILVETKLKTTYLENIAEMIAIRNS